MIHINCPGCGKAFRVKDGVNVQAFAGKKVKCPACAAFLDIPGRVETPTPAAEIPSPQEKGETQRLEEEERARREEEGRQADAVDGVDLTPPAAAPTELPAATTGAPSAITRLLGFGGGRIVTKKIMGAVAAGAVLGGAIVACVLWEVSASRSAAHRAGADVQAVSAPNENSAATSLMGNDLLAWKLAYEAAGHEADSRAKQVATDLIGVRYAINVVPDVPRRHLMLKKATGDYEFVFGMEFHQFVGGEATGNPEQDECLLGNLVATVVDFSGSMRCTRVEGGFFPLKDVKTFDDYVKLFGETDGVKADRNKLRAP